MHDSHERKDHELVEKDQDSHKKQTAAKFSEAISSLSSFLNEMHFAGG